jgi:hypothetical protein
MFSNKFEKLMSLQNDYIERINKNAVKLDKQLNFLNQVQNSLDKQMGGAQPLTQAQMEEYTDIFSNTVGLNKEELPDPSVADNTITSTDLANAIRMAEKAKEQQSKEQQSKEQGSGDQGEEDDEDFGDATDNPEGVPEEGSKKDLAEVVGTAKVGEKLIKKGKDAKEKVKGLNELSTMQKQEVKGKLFDAILELQVKENEKLKLNLESLKGTIEKLEETTDARLASAQKILESTKQISAPFNIDKLTESQETLVKEQLEKLQKGDSSVADVMKIFNFKKSSQPEEDRKEQDSGEQGGEEN